MAVNLKALLPVPYCAFHEALGLLSGSKGVQQINVRLTLSLMGSTYFLLDMILNLLVR